MCDLNVNVMLCLIDDDSDHPVLLSFREQANSLVDLLDVAVPVVAKLKVSRLLSIDLCYIEWIGHVEHVVHVQ